MVTICPIYLCSNHVRHDSSVLSIHWDSVVGSMLSHRSRSRLTRSEQMTAIFKPATFRTSSIVKVPIHQSRSQALLGFHAASTTQTSTVVPLTLRTPVSSTIRGAKALEWQLSV
jgi:hypothetical protein